MQNYPHIDNLLARASVDIARSLCTWDEVPSAEEPDTLDKARAYYNRTGRIAVTRMDDFMSGRLRLWGEALPWQCFFVWHDWCHVNVPGATFDPEGERVTHAAQVEQLARWASEQAVPVTRYQFARMEAVMAAHNIARLEHWRVHGEPPRDLRAFAYGYLAARDLAEERA